MKIMKKNNKINKIIILSVIGIILIISSVVFILNYTKDDSSFSILEKNWINNNSNNIIDISVYNDVPIYGQSGEGIIFSYLEEFTKTYGIQFNKISYIQDNNKNLKNVAFRILNYNTELTGNDIEIYKDTYIIASKNNTAFYSIDDLSDITDRIVIENVDDFR